MKVTLQVNGRKLTIYGVESISILDEDENTIKAENSDKKVYLQNTVLVDQQSRVKEKWFLVDAKTIDVKWPPVALQRRGWRGCGCGRLPCLRFSGARPSPSLYASLGASNFLKTGQGFGTFAPISISRLSQLPHS